MVSIKKHRNKNVISAFQLASLEKAMDEMRASYNKQFQELRRELEEERERRLKLESELNLVKRKPPFIWVTYAFKYYIFKEMFAIKILISKRQQPLFQNQVPNFCHDNEQPFQSKLLGDEWTDITLCPYILICRAFF